MEVRYFAEIFVMLQDERHGAYYALDAESSRARSGKGGLTFDGGGLL